MNTHFTAPLLAHFGLGPPGIYESAQHRMHAAEIAAAVEANQLVALTGEPGAGKTTLLRMARERMGGNVRIVTVMNRDRARLRAGHIATAAITQLSSESARRDLETRFMQFTRIVGSRFAAGERICIVVDEAHRIRGDAYAQLKDLRECEFTIGGKPVAPLFSLVLVGHPRLTDQLKRRRELHYRTLPLDLSEEAGWMTRRDREHYLIERFGQAIEEQTMKRIAALYQQPLALDYAVARAMREARAAGYPTVNDASLQLSIAELYEQLGRPGLADIAKAAGCSKASAHNALKGATSNPDILDGVRRALTSLWDAEIGVSASSTTQRRRAA